jgi:cytochrome c oxidase assembly protein subunit 15
MAPDSQGGDSPVSRGHALLLLAATGLTFLLVVLGGVVCVTDASGGCPDWPTCYGRFVPPLRIDSVLEYAHRLLAAVTSLAVFASALLGWRRPRAGRWVTRPPQLAVLFLIVVSVLGALTVLRGLSPIAAALDLGSALFLLALMVVAVVAVSRRRHTSLTGKLIFRGTFAWLALGTLLLVFLTLIAGVFAAPANPLFRCLGWPSYGDVRLGLDAGIGAHLARWLGACLAGVSILAVALQAWRSQTEPPPVLRATAVVGVLFSAASTFGLASQAFGYPQNLGLAHVVLAAGLWSSLVVLNTLAGLWAS